MRVQPRNNNNSGSNDVNPREKGEDDEHDDDERWFDDDDVERRHRRDLLGNSIDLLRRTDVATISTTIGKCLPVSDCTSDNNHGERTQRAKNIGKSVPIFAKRKVPWRGMENAAIEKGDGTGQIAASCPVTITCVCHESRWCIRSRLARSRASAESEFSLYVSPCSVFVSASRLSLLLARLPSTLSTSLSLSPDLTDLALLYFPSNASIFLARSFTTNVSHLCREATLYDALSRSIARERVLPVR